MRVVMVKFSSPEADHSLRPHLPLQHGPGWRGSCELTGARVIGRSMPVTQLAPWTTEFLPLRRQSLSSLMEGLQTTEPASSLAADQKFHFVANSLAKLLETARRELERDQEAAKASLVKAEIERRSGANGTTSGGLAAWQMLRVRAYIDSNLHRTIHIRDLSAVARRSPAHFSRKFKLAVGEPPHTYVVRRRLERACHLMMTSAASLSEIALSVGFSDQAHLCRLFRQAFGQSPAGPLATRARNSFTSSP
jgi:AraC family transcriptional regulator